jgi:hypothetical protein
MIVKKVKYYINILKFTLNQNYNKIMTKKIIHISINLNMYQ